MIVFFITKWEITTEWFSNMNSKLEWITILLHVNRLCNLDHIYQIWINRNVKCERFCDHEHIWQIWKTWVQMWSTTLLNGTIPKQTVWSISHLLIFFLFLLSKLSTDFVRNPKWDVLEVLIVRPVHVVGPKVCSFCVWAPKVIYLAVLTGGSACYRIWDVYETFCNSSLFCCNLKYKISDTFKIKNIGNIS